MISDYQQFLSITFYMYLIQGLPYGIQAKFLPIYMRSHGFSHSRLGIMKLLYLPLVLRTLYAPVINVYLSSKRWLQISIFLLFLNCVFIALIQKLNITYLVINFVAMNLLCSVQDVALDSLTLTILKDYNVNEGNVAQVVGYKIGALIGGGIILTMSEFMNWFSLFIITASFYALGVILTTFCRGFSDEYIDSFTRVYTDDMMEVQHNMSFVNYLKILKDSINNFTAYMTIAYLLLYKMGEQGATNMLSLFLIDKKIHIGKIGFWIGIVGQIFSVFGSGYAVLYVRKRGSTYQAITHLCIMIAPLVTILWVLVSPQFYRKFPDLLFPCCVIIINTIYLVSGILTTATFTLMMQCSQTRPIHLQSTNYTILATIEVMGKLMFTSTIGLFTDSYGYQYSYMLFTLFAWLTALFLLCSSRAFDFTIFRLSYRPRSICTENMEEL